MYAPVPGYAHILVVMPPESGQAIRPHDTEECGDRGLVVDLLTVAIEVAARQRPINHVRNEHYDSTVHYHLRHWLSAHPGTSATCEINSLHTQASGEFHGRVSIGTRQHAFTGVYADTKVSAFRLF